LAISTTSNGGENVRSFEANDTICSRSGSAELVRRDAVADCGRPRTGCMATQQLQAQRQQQQAWQQQQRRNSLGKERNAQANWYYQQRVLERQRQEYARLQAQQQQLQFQQQQQYQLQQQQQAICASKAGANAG
jgi:hypothetical protein